MDGAPRPSLLVLYASQTGNAQDVAERVGREAQRRHYAARVLPADAYMPHVASLPGEPAVVWVASTTGQGEQPANMRRLWRFLLRKSLPQDSLAGMRAAVFGLGDSGYPKYNVVAKKLYRRLEALGAALVLPLGLGDDQEASGHEAALDPWLARLWPALRAHFPLPPGAAEPLPDDSAAELTLKYRVTWLHGADAAAAAAAAAAEAAVCAPADGAATPDAAQHWEEVAAARRFDAVEAAASGAPPEAEAEAEAEAEQQPGGGGDRGAHGPRRPFWARLASNRRITAPAHWQDVRVLDLQLGAPGLSFQPGDVLAVVPRQPAGAVDALLRRCGWDGQAWVRVEAAGGGQGGGSGGGTAAVVQLRALLAGALDVNGASPRRSFFQALQPHTSSAAEAARLAHFASPRGRDELHEYCRREGRTVLEVLGDFPSAAPPLELLLQAGRGARPAGCAPPRARAGPRRLATCCARPWHRTTAARSWPPSAPSRARTQVAPRLAPRRFSIASSERALPGRAQLAVAVVDWATPFRRRRRGVCSGWLAALDPERGEARVPVWAERGALRLPPTPQTPLLMVGPGTGVAPFRAFLQERGAAAAAGDQPPPAPSWLFFGCRNEAGDFYFRDEWERAQAAGLLAPPPAGLATAFSRDGPRKVYVQQRLREHGAAVWALLSAPPPAGAWVYVAGSADKMPAQVAAAMQEVAEQHGGLTPGEAAALLRRMEATGRYQVEAWS